MTDPHCPAFIALPTEEDVRARSAPDAPESPYSFGFVAAMGLLEQAHPRIGPRLAALFDEVMVAPGILTRQEREMVASVAAAAQDCHY
jgi:alkylhydroperoxidase/carboxymuconolactone decarboxylase family protein YurZ